MNNYTIKNFIGKNLEHFRVRLAVECEKVVGGANKRGGGASKRIRYLHFLSHI